VQLIAHWIDWMLQQFHNQKTWKQKEWNCDHFRHHMGIVYFAKTCTHPKIDWFGWIAMQGCFYWVD
jgi:hypothetical protein